MLLHVWLRENGLWSFASQGMQATMLRKKKFYTDKILDTEEEAIQYSINFGKRIIDGDSDTCTVKDL
jgi:hypothetical protein